MCRFMVNLKLALCFCGCVSLIVTTRSAGFQTLYAVSQPFTMTHMGEARDAWRKGKGTKYESRANRMNQLNKTRTGNSASKNSTPSADTDQADDSKQTEEPKITEKPKPQPPQPQKVVEQTLSSGQQYASGDIIEAVWRTGCVRGTIWEVARITDVSPYQVKFGRYRDGTLRYDSEPIDKSASELRDHKPGVRTGARCEICKRLVQQYLRCRDNTTIKMAFQVLHTHLGGYYLGGTRFICVECRCWTYDPYWEDA